MVVVWFAAGGILLFVVALYVVYDICFSGNRKLMADETELPQGEQYIPFWYEVYLQARPCFQSAISLEKKK